MLFNPWANIQLQEFMHVDYVGFSILAIPQKQESRTRQPREILPGENLPEWVDIFWCKCISNLWIKLLLFQEKQYMK